VGRVKRGLVWVCEVKAKVGVDVDVDDAGGVALLRRSQRLTSEE
jgi:hypothetical protein